MDRAVHFVGFRGEEYNRAKRVWGDPDFIHRGWDKRAQREIMNGDTVLFAKGPYDQHPDPEHNFSDLTEIEPD